ncbi:hypothetical protein L6452_13953 [Arctium lappa]|uniref:Uncharacterized protein n=1 Tax=Arctium lappa TaxID=4217 RepID=A0ACB9CJJ0_ARCLA|nr:hypothetical protein L6452_13953 [Arctium lappa]
MVPMTQVESIGINVFAFLMASWRNRQEHLHHHFCSISISFAIVGFFSSVVPHTIRFSRFPQINDSLSLFLLLLTKTQIRPSTFCYEFLQLGIFFPHIWVSTSISTLQGVDNEFILWEPKMKEQSPGEFISQDSHRFMIVEDYLVSNYVIKNLFHLSGLSSIHDR